MNALNADPPHLAMNLAEILGEARRLSSRGEHNAAVQSLAALLRANPDNVDLYRELAQIRLAQGQRDVAQSLLRRAALLEQALEYTGDLEAERESSGLDGLDADVLYAQEVERYLQANDTVFSAAEHDPTAEQTFSERDELGSVSTSESSFPPTGQNQADGVACEERGVAEHRPVIRWKKRPRFGANCIEPRPDVVSVPILDREAYSAGDTLPSEEDDSQVIAEDLLAEEERELLLPTGDELEVWESEEADTSEVSSNEFDWADVDVTFDDETDDAAIEAEVLAAPLPRLETRIDLFRWAEKEALQLLQDAGRRDEGRHARADLNLLIRILLEGSANASRPEISVTVRARRIGELLRSGVSVEDVAAAHACREVWGQHPEFHIDLGTGTLGEAWMRGETARSTLPWVCALNFTRAFGATDMDEIRAVLLDLFDRWSTRSQIRREFPSFRRYVQYRLIPTGCLLDSMPFCVFDEADSSDYIERWEDDPVRASELWHELESNGLLPQFDLGPLDVPVAHMRSNADSEEGV